MQPLGLHGNSTEGLFSKNLYCLECESQRGIYNIYSLVSISKCTTGMTWAPAETNLKITPSAETPQIISAI